MAKLQIDSNNTVIDRPMSIDKHDTFHIKFKQYGVNISDRILFVGFQMHAVPDNSTIAPKDNIVICICSTVYSNECR